MAFIAIKFVAKSFGSYFTVSNNQQVEAPTSETEYNLADYDPFVDLAGGLSQRIYGRSDAKVNAYQFAYQRNNFEIYLSCKIRSPRDQIKRLQNGGVTSDDDVSITGSPNIRRRLGSYSGIIADQQSAKEETYSPGSSSLQFLSNAYRPLLLVFLLFWHVGRRHAKRNPAPTTQSYTLRR